MKGPVGLGARVGAWGVVTGVALGWELGAILCHTKSCSTQFQPGGLIIPRGHALFYVL